MRPTAPRFPVVRIPTRRTLVAAGLAVTVAIGVLRLTSSATATIDEYGPTVAVAVARRDLAVGHEIGIGDVDVVDRPTAHLPVGALDHVAPGTVVVQPVAAGEPVTASRLGAGRHGAAALIPADWRAVVVPTRGVLPVEVGQRVDVVAVTDPESGRAAVIVGGAVVVATDGRGEVTVAVPDAAVPAVVGALVGGVVTLALAG